MLVADVGGTKVVVAQAEFKDGINISRAKTYASSSGSCFEEILRRYIEEERPSNRGSMVIGVAGPVFNNSCIATNLPWQLHGKQIAAEFGLTQVALINDLVAQAYGVRVCPQDNRVSINQGQKLPGQSAVIAAGTGLGEAIICHFEDRDIVLGTEGGHTDFGPSCEIEIELLRYLLQRHKRVSWERVVSGRMGFANIYNFLREHSPNLATHPLPNDLHHEDYGPHVSQAADRNCPLAIETLRVFIRLYGAEAGNLALKSLSTSGVYIAGGIAKKLMKWIVQNEWFMTGFLNKGRFSPLLALMPVTIITDDHNALRGAANYAVQSRLL